MVSTKTLNSVLIEIKDLMLDIKTISISSKIRFSETKHAINVLHSNGYVLKSNSKGINKGEKYKFTYYIASESAKEILNKGGFKKQLSMKENNKTSIKNKMSIKDSTINKVNQGSTLEKFEATILKQTKTPNENEKQQSAITKRIGKWFWLFVIPLVIGVVLIAIQFKWFR